MDYYGEWTSEDCSVKYPFICKMPAAMSTDFTTVYPPTAPTNTQPCDKDQPDNGWLSNPSDSENRYCYYFNTKSKLSWKDAEEQCGIRGGSLVSIHSNHENGFVLSNLEHSDTWLGFNSIYSGDWEWTDKSNVGFMRWAPGGNFSLQLYICLGIPNKAFFSSRAEWK